MSKVSGYVALSSHGPFPNWVGLLVNSTAAERTLGWCYPRFRLSQCRCQCKWNALLLVWSGRCGKLWASSLVVGLRLPRGNFIIELLLRYWSISRKKARIRWIAECRFQEKNINDAICRNSREFPSGILWWQIPGNSRTGIPGGLDTLAKRL